LDREAFYADLYRDDCSEWLKTCGRVREMRDFAKSHGVPFAVMIIPDIQDLRPGTACSGIYAKIERDLKAMGIPALSAYGPLQARFGGDERELWIQVDDPHPNGKGHAFLADLLYRWLVSEDPLKMRVRPALSHAF
jgi:lysophospholipase L1-like esterase